MSETNVPPLAEASPQSHQVGTGRRPLRCWRCGEQERSLLFCQRCGVIQPFPEDTDYFEVFGLPRSLALDQNLLKQRYYELHRLLHPDRFQTSSPEERQASLRNTALINQAYRTLKDPEDRGVYWLTLHGEALGKRNQGVPPDLAALVFETQELLEEFSQDPARQAEVERVREHIVERCAALRARLEEFYARFPSAAGSAELAELKRILSALSYLSTLLRDVERALEKHSR